MCFFRQDDVILSPREDSHFKSIFTKNTRESKIALIDLISSFTNRKVSEVVVINNDQPKNDKREKGARLDISCVIDSGDAVNVEMQRDRLDGDTVDSSANLIRKSLKYSSSLFIAQGEKGKGYHTFGKVYHISICDFSIFSERKGFIHEVKPRFSDGQDASDDINLIFIDLTKLEEIMEKSVSDMTPAEMWGIFMKSADNVKHRNVVNNIFKNKEEIAMAGKLLEMITQDDYDRAIRMSQDKYETDLDHVRWASYDKGMAEGEIKGKVEGKIEVVKNMLEVGTEIEFISKTTNLSIEEIEEIRNSNKVLLEV